MTYEPPVTDYDHIVENCTCAFCGCNCDDLDFLVKDGHVVAVRHACRLGASKVMEDMDQRLLVPMVRNEEGVLEEVDWDTALDTQLNTLQTLLDQYSTVGLKLLLNV